MRALKTMVIGMGVLIVLALVLLVYGLVKRSSDPTWKLFGPSQTAQQTAPAPATAPPPPPAPAGAAFGDVALPAPASCRIAGMKTAAGMLYLRLDGPDPACNAVIAVDAASGKVRGRLTPGGS